MRVVTMVEVTSYASRIENKYDTDSLELLKLGKEEGRAENIRDIIEEIKDEEKMERELEIGKKEREEKAKHNKDKKENEKKDKMETARLVGLRWGLMKWVTAFLLEKEIRWSLERQERERESRKTLESWEKLMRQEKIKKIRRKKLEEDQMRAQRPKLKKSLPCLK